MIQKEMVFMFHRHYVYAISRLQQPVLNLFQQTQFLQTIQNCALRLIIIFSR